MKALSFLGTGKYHTVTYYWPGSQQSCQTHLFPEAVARIVQPEKLLVLVTAQVKRHQNFQMLCERLGELVQPVDIPEGKSVEDLWSIFECCATVIMRGEEMVLDVTHAFRSLPLVVFTIAGFLRRTQNIEVRHIVYGAYEARQPFRDPPEPTDQAPIFDLTPLLELFDWLSGAEAFLLRSDAEILGIRLKQTHRHLWTARAGNKLPYHLQAVGAGLTRLSRAMHLSRPLEVMREAQQSLPKLESVKAEARQWVPPFAVLLEQVRAEIEPLAHGTPERLDADNLRKQLALIQHFLQKNLIVQAVTLSREWLVSWVVLHQKKRDDWLDRTFRVEVEHALGKAVKRGKGEEVRVPEWFEELPESEKVSKLWDSVAQLRNNVAHCGMSKEGAQAAEGISRRIEEIVEQLSTLPLS